MRYVVNFQIFLNGYKKIRKYLKMIKAIIFDLDDTIWNYTEADTFACSCVFNKIKNLVHPSMKDKDLSVVYKKIVCDIKSSNNISNKHNKIIYFKKIFEYLRISLKYLGDIMKEYQSKFESKLYISNGVRQLFSLLKKNNIKIGVLSNNHFYEQYHRLEIFSLISFVDVIVTTDEIGEEKPSNQSFLELIHKLNVSPENIIMVGDNINHDIIPAQHVKIGLCLWYKPTSLYPLSFGAEIGIFQNFEILYEWLYEILKAIPLYKYLCGYFSQSFQNIQGTGGNISIKLPNNTLIIKTSGTSLGDPNEYCIINQITQQKIMGRGKPSMETGFHCNISSHIVVHLHFLPMNRYLCCDKYKIDLVEFEKPYYLVPYSHPGKDLSEEIKKHNVLLDNYTILLDNHGIILCSSSVEEMSELYKYIFQFCDDTHRDYRLYKFYDRVKKVLDGQFIYSVQVSSLEQVYIRHIKYCFPDMVIFLQNVDDETSMTKYSDIVISQENDIYIVASCLKEYRSKQEVLESYLEICKYNYNDLIEIDDIQSLITMPIEIERKKKNRI